MPFLSMPQIMLDVFHSKISLLISFFVLQAHVRIPPNQNLSLYVRSALPNQQVPLEDISQLRRTLAFASLPHIIVDNYLQMQRQYCG